MTASSAEQSDQPVAVWFRERLETLFEMAVETTPVVERRYVIGGSRVLLRFAGEAMLDRLAGAFAHLEKEFTETPSLTVNIWDSDSTSTEPPPQLGEPIEEVGPDNSFSGPVYYHESDGLQALARWRTLAALDSTTNTGWFWAPAAGEMLSWDWAYPLRPILDWWLFAQEIVLAHGGAVGIREGGVAIVGPGRSGKSTSALATIGSELKYGGDDLIGIQLDGSPWIYSLYSSGKLASHHIARFPHLADAVVNPDRGSAEKAVAYVHERFPGTTATDFPLRAVVVPRITDRVEPRLVPASPGAALTALAPSTILQAHPHRPESLRMMSRLVRVVPSFDLELGSNLERIPEVLLDFLKRG